jgi:N-acetylneuraminic acid mutarotase
MIDSEGVANEAP